MNRATARIPPCLAIGLLLGWYQQSSPTRVTFPTRPNFVFILGEGHGWSSTSVRMDDAVPESKSAFVRTPNFEKLAPGGHAVRQFLRPVAALHAVARRDLHRAKPGPAAHDVRRRGQEG